MNGSYSSTPEDLAVRSATEISPWPPLWLWHEPYGYFQVHLSVLPNVQVGDVPRGPRVRWVQSHIYAQLLGLSIQVASLTLAWPGTDSLDQLISELDCQAPRVPMWAEQFCVQGVCMNHLPWAREVRFQTVHSVSRFPKAVSDRVLIQQKADASRAWALAQGACRSESGSAEPSNCWGSRST